MGRKRAPENDYICLRCGCPCDRAGTRHVGGGQGLRACLKPPTPMLRSQLEADARDVVAGLEARRRTDWPHA